MLTPARLAAPVLLAAFAAAAQDGATVIPDILVIEDEGPPIAERPGEDGTTERPGDVVIPPLFEAAGNFQGRTAPVRYQGQWYLLDAEYGLEQHETFDALLPGGDSMFGFLRDGLWGYLNAEPFVQVAIPPAFDEITRFRNGSAAVLTGDRWALIDSGGWQRSSDRYWVGPDLVPTAIRRFAVWDGDVFIAEDDVGWAVFDLSQWGSLGPRLSLDPWQEGRGPVLDVLGMWDDIVVTRDRDGVNLARRFTDDVLTGYHDIGVVSDGFVAVAPEPGVWGYYHVASDSTAWVGRYEDARAFASGYAPVRIDGLWGYIDIRGEIAWQPEFDDAYPFRDGYAVVRRGDLRGFLRAGHDGISMFIEPRFQDAYRFTDSLAPVMIDDAWGYVWNGEVPGWDEHGYGADNPPETISPP